MAGLIKTLKASTLIEVIVALLILVVVTTLVTSSLIRNYKRGSTASRLEAFLLLDNVVEKTIKEKSFDNESFETENIRIIKQVLQDYQNKDLVSISFTVEDHNENVLLERYRVFLKNDSVTYQAND